MKLDGNLEIRAMVANRIPLAGGGAMHGDVYGAIEDMRREHPEAKPVFGACIMDRDTGLVPDGYADWYGSVQEAYEDWAKKSRKAFRLTIEYDGTCDLRISYNDGSDNETHDARTKNEVLGIVKEAVETALAPEAD